MPQEHSRRTIRLRILAVLVYAQDFNHSARSIPRATGFYGGTLDHPMNYLFARWSDSTTYSMFSANSSGGLDLGFQPFNTSTTMGHGDGPNRARDDRSPTSRVREAGGGSWSYMDVETAYDNSARGQTTTSQEFTTRSLIQLRLAYGSTLGTRLKA